MRKSTAEDMVIIFSRMPWWACLTLAAISYFVLDHFSIKFGQPIGTTGFQIGTMGEFVTKQMWKTMAFFGKFFFPFIFGIAAIASIVRSIDNKNNTKKWIMAIFGFIFLILSINALFKIDRTKIATIQNETKKKYIEKDETRKIASSRPKPVNNLREVENTEKKAISKQVIYSWTNKEGNRVHSNMGFPKNETFSEPKIEYH